MPLVVPHEGLLLLLNGLLKNRDASFWELRLALYQNDYTPDRDTTFSDFTEADFDGYARIDLDNETWLSAVTVSDKAKTFYGSAAQEFEVTGATGNTIYGYFVIDNLTDTIAWAQRFATPRGLQEFDKLNVYPEFTLDSEYDP